MFYGRQTALDAAYSADKKRDPLKAKTWWISRMRVQLVIRRLQVRPSRVRKNFFVEIGHKIFSTAILSLPLIQEGQLSALAQGCAQVLVNHLDD